MRRDARFYLDGSKRALRMALDGLSDAQSHPERRERGLCVAIEFGRSVGEALRRLKSRVPGYDEWWLSAKETYLSHPVCAYLYDKRNDIFHEGHLLVNRVTVPPNVKMVPEGILVDGQLFIAPPDADSFVFGDTFGNDGWAVGDSDIVTYALSFPRPSTSLQFDDAPGEFKDRPAIDAVEFWLSRLTELVDDAEQKLFGAG